MMEIISFMSNEGNVILININYITSAVFEPDIGKPKLAIALNSPLLKEVLKFEGRDAVRIHLYLQRKVGLKLS